MKDQALGRKRERKKLLTSFYRNRYGAHVPDPSRARHHLPWRRICNWADPANAQDQVLYLVPAYLTVRLAKPRPCVENHS